MIQETKKRFIDRKCLSSFWGRQNCKWTDIPSNGAVRGLLIIWKSDLFDIVTSEHGIYLLSVKLRGKQDGIYDGSFVFTVSPQI